MRYKAVRAISFPVPLLSSMLPFIGGKTLPEIAIIILVAVLFLAVGCRGAATNSGTAAQLLAGAAILGSLRKLNLYNIVFGISFERALFWHKLMAILFFACLAIHSFLMIKSHSLSASGNFD